MQQLTLAQTGIANTLLSDPEHAQFCQQILPFADIHIGTDPAFLCAHRAVCAKAERGAVVLGGGFGSADFRDL